VLQAGRPLRLSQAACVLVVGQAMFVGESDQIAREGGRGFRLPRSKAVLLLVRLVRGKPAQRARLTAVLPLVNQWQDLSLIPPLSRQHHIQDHGAPAAPVEARIILCPAACLVAVPRDERTQLIDCRPPFGAIVQNTARSGLTNLRGF
jgi:hypothetical protein